MTNYKKNFYILSGSIFLIFSLLASASYSYDVCSDYIIEVRPEYSDQTPGQSLNADVQGETNITGNTIRLELFFSLRQHSNSPILLQVMGIGTSRNFQAEFGINLGPLNTPLGVEEHLSDTISQVVREAIRNGYERLRESLREQGALKQQHLDSTISTVLNNKILIPLGRSDYVQEGDVFYIYPGDNSHYNGCNTVRRSGPYLTTATVIEIDQNTSMLEMGIFQTSRRNVQVGDIVELSPYIDFESRTQGHNHNNEPRPNTLRLGFTPNIFIIFRTDRSRFNDRYSGVNNYYGNDRITRRNITPLIRNFLLTEAGDYNFRVIQ